MDEHPEARIAPPRQPRVALGLSFGGVQRGRLTSSKATAQAIRACRVVPFMGGLEAIRPGPVA